MQKIAKMNSRLWLYFLLMGLYWQCDSSSSIEAYGQSYQKHQDYESLKQVVEGLDLGTDTAQVKAILGQPIDMGFDYRYLIDSVGPNGCVIGAVFHIDDVGKIDQKWIDEICE